jgi:curved DNA-binding protein CbpA
MSAPRQAPLETYVFEPKLDSNNLREVLGVTQDASLDIIKNQYRILAMQYHPNNMEI